VAVDASSSIVANTAEDIVVLDCWVLAASCVGRDCSMEDLLGVVIGICALVPKCQEIFVICIACPVDLAWAFCLGGPTVFRHRAS